MPKPKQFLKNTKKKTSKFSPKAPETADEFLAAGVDFEEAGEKWRGGDAEKSIRFFGRAIATYEEGLKIFPNSFDLAYNKARVQYELTQHPKLAARLHEPLLDLLRVALQSSRYALTLNQDNADVLFNTAQVLTSLVEALSSVGSGTSLAEDGLQLLEEALELFQRCFSLQEYQYTLAHTQSTDHNLPSDVPMEEFSDTEDGGASLSGSQADGEERWATVLEQVTNDTLLDTIFAQLETLTTLCGLVTANEGKGLAWIDEYATGLLDQKMPSFPPSTNREEEAALIKANFRASLSDANYRHGLIDTVTYQRAIDEAFTGLDLKDNPEGLCDKAEALMSYNFALHAGLSGQAPENTTTATRWTALSVALESLTAASKLPSADNLPKIHLARGDVELLRYQLGQHPTSYGPAKKNGAMLLKNAGTFYRGAESHAARAGSQKEIQEAAVKLALASGLGGDIEGLKHLCKLEPAACQRVLEDAVEDGLVSYEWLVDGGFAGR